MRVINVIAGGIGSKAVHFRDDGMTASAALADAGVKDMSADSVISVNGGRARADSPVRPGDTVQLQPRAENG